MPQKRVVSGQCHVIFIGLVKQEQIIKRFYES